MMAAQKKKRKINDLSDMARILLFITNVRAGLNLSGFSGGLE
jgi:hypothetical protein